MGKYSFSPGFKKFLNALNIHAWIFHSEQKQLVFTVCSMACKKKKKSLPHSDHHWS